MKRTFSDTTAANDLHSDAAGSGAAPADQPRKKFKHSCKTEFITDLPLDEAYSRRVTCQLPMASTEVWYDVQAPMFQRVIESGYEGLPFTKDTPKFTKRDYERIPAGSKKFQHTSCLHHLMERLCTPINQRSYYEMMPISPVPRDVKYAAYSWCRIGQDLEIYLDSNPHITFESWPAIEAALLAEFRLWLCDVFGLNPHNPHGNPCQYYITDASTLEGDAKISRHYTWVLMIPEEQVELVVYSNIDTAALMRCFECYVVDRWGDCTQIDNPWYTWVEKSKLSQPPDPTRERALVFDLSIGSRGRSMREPCSSKWPKYHGNIRPLRPIRMKLPDEYLPEIKGPEAEYTELCTLLDEYVSPMDTHVTKSDKLNKAREIMRLMPPYTILYPFRPGEPGSPERLRIYSCYEPDGVTQACSIKSGRNAHLNMLMLQKQSPLAVDAGNNLAEFMEQLQLELEMSSGALTTGLSSALPKLNSQEWRQFKNKYNWTGAYWGGSQNQMNKGDRGNTLQPALCKNMLLSLFQDLMCQHTASELYAVYSNGCWGSSYEEMQERGSINSIKDRNKMTNRTQWFMRNGQSKPFQLMPCIPGISRAAPVGTPASSVVFRSTDFNPEDMVFSAYTNGKFCPALWLDSLNGNKDQENGIRMHHKSNHTLLLISLTDMSFKWICLDQRKRDGASGDCRSLPYSIPLPPAIVAHYKQLLHDFEEDWMQVVSVDIPQQIRQVLDAARECAHESDGEDEDDDDHEHRPTHDDDDDQSDDGSGGDEDQCSYFGQDIN